MTTPCRENAYICLIRRLGRKLDYLSYGEYVTKVTESESRMIDYLDNDAVNNDVILHLMTDYVMTPKWQERIGRLIRTPRKAERLYRLIGGILNQVEWESRTGDKFREYREASIWLLLDSPFIIRTMDIPSATLQRLEAEEIRGLEDILPRDLCKLIAAYGGSIVSTVYVNYELRKRKLALL